MYVHTSREHISILVQDEGRLRNTGNRKLKEETDKIDSTGHEMSPRTQLLLLTKIIRGVTEEF